MALSEYIVKEGNFQSIFTIHGLVKQVMSSTDNLQKQRILLRNTISYC